MRELCYLHSSTVSVFATVCSLLMGGNPVENPILQNVVLGTQLIRKRFGSVLVVGTLFRRFSKIGNQEENHEFRFFFGFFFFWGGWGRGFDLKESTHAPRIFTVAAVAAAGMPGAEGGVARAAAGEPCRGPQRGPFFLSVFPPPLFFFVSFH